MMRRLATDHAPPECLQDWRRENDAVPQNLVYGEGNFPKKCVLDSLIDFQSKLCAYTMIIIDETNCHIEHFKPQRRCRQEDREREVKRQNLLREDIEWNNLFACYPKNPNIAYGAAKKQDYFDENLLLNPRTDDPSLHLRFRMDGRVDYRSMKGENTIEVLGLNHSELVDLRRKVYIEYGISDLSPSLASREEATLLAATAANDTGRFQFSGAFSDVVDEYIRWLDETETP